MTRFLARWNDFSKGDPGWVDKTRLAVGYYQGVNVVTYRDGSVGPRAGFLNMAAAGSPAGTVRDLGYVDLGDATKKEYVWGRFADKIYRIPVYNNTTGVPLTGQTWALAAGGPLARDDIGDSVEGNPQITLITVFADKCYVINWNSGANGTISSTPGSPGGTSMEIFGNFLVVAHITGHHNRLVWSAKGDYSSWPAANFLDIGDDVHTGAPGITAIRKLKDALVVFTETGQIFTITGTLGENEIVREFQYGDHMTSPDGPQALARARDGALWWTRREDGPSENDPAYALATALPVNYTAGQRNEIPEMSGWLEQRTKPSNRVSQTLVVPGRGDKSVVIMDRVQKHLLQRDGVWTRHYSALEDKLHAAITDGVRGDLYMIDSPATILYAYQFELERPAWDFADNPVLPVSIDDLGNNTQPAGWMATPEMRDPQQNDMIVEYVEVLFTSYHTWGKMNTMGVSVQCFDQPNAQEAIGVEFGAPNDYDAPGLPAAMTQFGVTIACTPPISDTGDATRRRRVRFYPTDKAARATPAFRVVLTGLRGVSIHEIVAFGTLGVTDVP